jgi:hypothetical protein
MPYDGRAVESGGLVSEADEVIRAFGMAPTPTNLCSMAAEIERGLHIYPGGPVQASRVIRELQRRAAEARLC